MSFPVTLLCRRNAKCESRTATLSPLLQVVYLVVHLINKDSSFFCNHLAGSTDFGNVSFVVPGLHPFFYICTEALNHTEEYTEAAGTPARV